MNLELDASLGQRYPGPTQWARTVTEGWAKTNLYCAACASPRLTAFNANQAVEDFHCPLCSRRVQLKAKNGRIGGVVRNSAYSKKQAAIMENRAPDYCFLGYSKETLRVNDLLWVPGHFVTLSVIERCRPLKPEARRAGWIGSNILLHRVPDHGKIPLVADGVARPAIEVRKQFQTTAFLQGLPSEQRGWISDVLACVDDVAGPGQTFTNGDMYALDERLARLHPANQNIRPKIRQQLQVLARQGVVERLAPGRYRRL